jgi:hypothetical protein
MNKEIKVLGACTEQEISRRAGFVDLLKNTPIPNSELLSNLGLYLNRQSLSRILFMEHLYKKILNKHGVIFEFGVRWGQNMALFSSFRGMYEPFNYNRKLVGFDTFSGFPSVAGEDGNLVSEGDYGVTENYEEYLTEILKVHQNESPIPHINKFQLVKGDAVETVTKYLTDNPQTIVSLAYFDFDIYHPTKKCLEAILPHLTKGSILAFDELNCEEFPGETLALKEVIDINKYEIIRDVNNPLCSYIIF